MGLLSSLAFATTSFQDPVSKTMPCEMADVVIKRSDRNRIAFFMDKTSSGGLYFCFVHDRYGEQAINGISIFRGWNPFWHAFDDSQRFLIQLWGNAAF